MIKKKPSLELNKQISTDIPMIAVTRKKLDMETKFRKTRLLVGSLYLSMSTFAYGNAQNNSSAYNSSMESTSQSGQGGHQGGTSREITLPAGLRVAHGNDIFFTADFIWWKATEDKLDFASNGMLNEDMDSYETFETFVQEQASVDKGKITSINGDWAPGFKVGLGLNMGHDGWDLYAQYTWLHASTTKSAKDDRLLMTQYTPGETVTSNVSRCYFSDVLSKWDLHFNAIDLELGRNFYLSQFLTIRPHIGLKGTWQSHNWKNIGNNEAEIEMSTLMGNLSGPIRAKKHYSTWGIGLRGGLNMTWYMSKCWSIYGDLALSTLWTKYRQQTDRIEIDAGSFAYSDIVKDDDGNITSKKNIEDAPTFTLANNNSEDNYKCKYIAEIGLGARWETWLYDDNYHVAIQAGFEQQTWVNWSNLNPYNSFADMSLQGLNLKFRFDF